MSLDQLEGLFLNGLAWGAGLALALYIGVTAAARSVLGHPTAVKLATAASRISKDGGDWLTVLIREGFGYLKAQRDARKGGGGSN